ncbi:MAG: flagellar M-ring protein FliF [Thermoleophilaceae bacterium]|jgi:flagellar M-ring protein FliF|nr:flagellar M-ring protein FliF [Thermoleophilaceae bacterium]
MGSLRSILANTTPKGRLVLAASAVGVVLFAFFMMRLASAPSYATVLTGMDPAETGKVTAALDAKGVKYEIQNNGTALAVDKSQTATARIALAEKGLPATGQQKGMELFDNTKLGASDFQQQVTYQRALEGEIARTVEQVNGVSGAQIQLVLPQDQLFQNEQSAAKAAVLLSGSSSSLQPGAVRGIAQLVASSVKGLKLSDVTITDGSGQLLWPNGQDGGASDGQMAATAKQAAEARYAQQTESNLNAMLAQTLGPGKAQVQVHAVLNTDQATSDKLIYAKKGVPLHTQKESEKLKGGGAAGGAAGTGSNIPSYAGTAGSGSNYTRTGGTTDWGVDKEVIRTKIAPGAVQKLDVAMIVDKTVPPAELAQLRGAVQSAAGMDKKRGDTLAVSQVAFMKPPAPKKASPVTSILSYAKYAGAGLAMLLFLAFVTRALRKREDQALIGEPTWLREIEAPMSLAQLEGPDGLDDTQVLTRTARPPQNPVRGELEDLIEKNPDKVAQQVRAWMNEE